MTSDIRTAMLAFCGARRYVTVTDIHGMPPFTIQSLTISEQEVLTAKVSEGSDDGYIFADYAIAAIVDENGDAVFGEMHRDQLAAMDMGKAEKITRRIIDHCRGDDGASTIEDAKKNSETTTKPGSSDGCAIDSESHRLAS